MNIETLTEFKAFVAEYAGKKIKVHYGEDEELYWVGVKEKYHGYGSELPIATHMQKEVAEAMLELVKSVW